MTTKARKIANKIRTIVIDAVEAHKDDPVAIACSGGVDSCSILAACAEVGVEPIVVSYTPNTHESTDFEMARDNAAVLGFEFAPAVIPVDPETLERGARLVIGMGFTKKVQVESLIPMLRITKVAAQAGAKYLFTGDGAGGLFCLSRWDIFDKNATDGNIDMRQDTTSDRIDAVRRKMFADDKSNSGPVNALCERAGLEGLFPYRERAYLHAMLGSTYREVNKPRHKEPIKLAFEDWFGDPIQVRPQQINLHMGDSYFTQYMEELLTQPHLQGRWTTPAGLYGAMARGQV